MAVIPKQFQS